MLGHFAFEFLVLILRVFWDMWVETELFSTLISYRFLKVFGGVHVDCRPIFRRQPEKSHLLGTWKVGGIHSGKASLHNGYLLQDNRIFERFQ